MTTLSCSSIRPSESAGRASRNLGLQGRRRCAARADQWLEVLERQRVVLGIERDLVPVVGEPCREIEPGVALVLGTCVRVAAEVLVVVGAPVILGATEQ